MAESIIGQEQVIERLLVTLLANGNLLLEGFPGLAKTRAVKSLARNLESEFRRIQFTPICRGFSFLLRQPVYSILAGRHASRLRGRGLNFEEIRRYLPGDDIRNMDWRVTARTRRPHVRVYTEERDRPLLLVIDQRQSMFFGSRRAMKSVVAAEAAALADIYAQLDALRTHQVQTVSHRPRRQLFHWPLGVGLLLSLTYHLAWVVRIGLRNSVLPATAAAHVGMAAVFSISTGLSQFHFLRPWWWLALAPALWMVWMIRRHQDAARPWHGVVEAHLLPHLLLGAGPQRRLQTVHLLLPTGWRLRSSNSVNPDFVALSCSSPMACRQSSYRSSPLNARMAQPRCKFSPWPRGQACRFLPTARPRQPWTVRRWTKRPIRWTPR
jgi:DNA polymerase III delta prime subunit